MTPEMPPIVNSPTSAIANFIAAVKRRLPPHIVKIQLKIFTPVGMAMSIVVTANTESAIGPMPTANMWCAHTPKPRKRDEDSRVDHHRSSRRSACGRTSGRISDTRPNAGRIRM